MGFDLDDDPTPKKKEKTTKIPVRQAVEASRQKPESHRENEEVSSTPLLITTVVNLFD